ncbi:MAG: tetratricopeptide (TPR) repeat protein [Verrucomicrobiales bacterium]|jgi:tetratricopeptide (TPR) repeat protein
MRKPLSPDAVAVRHHNRGSSARRPYVGEEDVRIVLERLPKPLWSRLGDVVFRDHWRRGTLGYVSTRGRRDIVLCDLPTHLSLRKVCAKDGISPEEFGAPSVGQWPPLAIRRYQLYGTLLHEIGHLQIVHLKNSNPRRKFADEPKAEYFAQEWRGRLWAKPFDHPDPAHNPPNGAELATLRSNWAEAHQLYRHQLKSENETRERNPDRHRDGRAIYQRAVDLFPQHSLALMKLGKSLYVMKDGDPFENAFECFQRARFLDPWLPEASLCGGMCLGRLGRVDEMREWFARAILLDQHHPLNRCVFAEELARNRQLEEAERLFRAILRKHPRHDYALRAYARFLYYKFKELRDDEAISCFRKLVEIKPNHYKNLVEFGHALVYAGTSCEALKVLTDAIQLCPNDPKAYELRRDVFLGLDREEDAERDKETIGRLKESIGKT